MWRALSLPWPPGVSRRGGRTSASGYVPSSEALLWPRCGSCVPPRGSTAAPGPAGPPPPPPDEGAGARSGPPKGIVPSCCCTPPPEPADTVDRPQHPGMPLVVAATTVPHPLCPLHDLHTGARCSSHRVCIGRRGCLVRFPPTRCALFCGGEGGKGCLGCPGTAPGGRAGLAPPVLRRSPPLPPVRRPPRDGGGGRLPSPDLAPPLGRIRGPRWGVNALPFS